MDWRQVGLLYRREIRAALREKSIVINSILIPAFLYPFLLWAVLNGILFATGQGEKARRSAARTEIDVNIATALDMY